MAALTGFEMMQIMDSGQNLAQASTKSLTMEAFVLNRSSLVMPRNTIMWVHYTVSAAVYCTYTILYHQLSTVRTLHLHLPGFLGTPAGMTTMLEPERHASNWSVPM